VTFPLPPNLIAALRGLSQGVSEKSLAQAYARLSQRYRDTPDGGSFRLAGEEEALAYALTRMPATAAVLGAVLSEALERLPKPSAVIDCGSGPGAAAFVLADLLPQARLTLVEDHPAMLAIGRLLLKDAHWAPGSFLTFSGEADWLMASYALSEVRPTDRAKVLPRFYKAAQQALILIEPGTPRGFAVLKEARDRLIALGGHVVAPCPHQKACPLPEGDWCHFSQRLPRLKAHKAAKAADAPFEDEPYAYLIIAKPDVVTRDSGERILRPVQQSKAGLSLRLCTPEGLEERFVPARDKDIHRRLRRLGWGDALDTGEYEP